jgi:hypothetical protein
MNRTNWIVACVAGALGLAALAAPFFMPTPPKGCDVRIDMCERFAPY